MTLLLGRSLEFAASWAILWSLGAVLHYRLRLSMRSLVTVRERGVQIGEEEGGRSLSYTSIGRVEQLRGSVRLHLVSGDKIDLQELEDLPALADAVRDRVPAPT